MTVTRNHRGPQDVTHYLMLGGMLLALAVLGTLWVAVELGSRLEHTVAPPGNPLALVIKLASGKARWPGAWATALWAVQGLVLVVATGAGAIVARRVRRTRTRVDVAAGYLADREEQRALSRREVTKTAIRLGAPADAPGVPIGPAVGSGERLYLPYEWNKVVISGTRRGKTTTQAIPAVLAAPGPTVVTSNKRDIVDACRLVCEQRGRAWLFDPQQLASTQPEMWWNPLSFVTDVERAVRLADCFAAYGRDAATRTDAFFDPSGRELTAWLLLAAAAGDYPITRAYAWVSDETNAEPVDVLRGAGHELPADSVQGVISGPDRQRGGIYATAKLHLACLVNPKITRWVTQNDAAPQFHPEQFVRRGGAPTLFMLSKEGLGTAGALVTGLTMAVFDAAEQFASTLPYGRLRMPMVAVLDEAPNVCRIRDLPDLYTHYGSRGIVLLTFLQTWAQGVTVWGEHGMDKLWSAANVAVYGGGNRKGAFLRELSEMIGQFEPVTSSLTVQHGYAGHRGRSYQFASRPESILDVADLQALPPGRAIMLASGMRPVLIAPEPWMDGPHAAAVRASLQRYEPQAEAARRVAGEADYRAQAAETVGESGQE